MAPPVVNSEGPHGTDSEEKESENAQVSAPSKPALNIDSIRLESAAPTTHEVLQPPIQSLADLTSIDTSAEKTSTDPTTDVLDTAPATYIHPWDGPPVYPPGTYRGMF
jgi:hypothetical protein